jgi:hypothetical protein
MMGQGPAVQYPGSPKLGRQGRVASVPSAWLHDGRWQRRVNSNKGARERLLGNSQRLIGWFRDTPCEQAERLLKELSSRLAQLTAFCVITLGRRACINTPTFHSLSKSSALRISSMNRLLRAERTASVSNSGEHQSASSPTAMSPLRGSGLSRGMVGAINMSPRWGWSVGGGSMSGSLQERLLSHDSASS